MKKTLTKLLPRIIPIVALIILITACFLAKPIPPHNPTIDIPDDDVPLSCLVDAYYFVAHPDVSFDDLSSLTEDMFDFVGEGSVFFVQDIYDDVDAVNEAINSSPDISGLVGDGQTIEWRFIVQNEDTIIVAGSYADIDIEEEASENDPIEAEYYIYNPRFFKATNTNVSPKIAQYIGDGLYYYKDDLYNDPDTVWSQIAEEPEYTAPSGKYIEWGSAFLYRGKNVVIGRYVEGEKPDLPNAINDIDLSTSFMEEESSEFGDIDLSFEDESAILPEQELIDVVATPSESEMAASEPQSSTHEANVFDYGAVGDGKSDDTNAILSAVSENDKVYFPAGIYKINAYSLSSLTADNIYGEGVLQFTPWSKQWVVGTYTNVYDGTCEISRMDDPIYMAAHWPSEGLMTEDSRNNISVSTQVKLDDTLRKICYHGAIVRVKDTEIPDNFTICLGKGQLYAYKNGQWILLNESLPSFGLYDASWKNPSMSVPQNCITRYSDHIEITLNKDLWFPNGDEMLLHYFCQSYGLAVDETATDYEYFFVTFTAWAKDESYSDDFLFGCSIDMRNTENKVTELGIGKMYRLKSTPRTAYFYNVPDSKYDELIAPYFH